MAYIELQIVALNDSESSPGNYVVVLEQTASHQRVPIIIGAAEAQSIALYLEKLQPPRPLTHDLFVTTLQALDARLEAVQIEKLDQQIYHSALLIRKSDNTLLAIDSRTSDALAIAIRFEAPIRIDEELFHQQALPEPNSDSSLRGSVWEYSLAELELLLQDLLDKEDYESAAKVRDILEKKKARDRPNP